MIKADAMALWGPEGRSFCNFGVKRNDEAGVNGHAEVVWKGQARDVWIEVDCVACALVLGPW